MSNIICLPHGPASRRSGIKYIYGVEDNAVKGLLYGYDFSQDQAYTIEFCDLKIRFLKDDGIILDGGSPYELVSPYAEADLPDLDFTSIGDTIYISHPDYNTRVLVRFDHNNWTISEADHDDGPFLNENITPTTMAPSVPGTGVAWDVRSAEYSGNSAYLFPSSQHAVGVEFKTDGSKMFISNSTSNTVEEYSLSTPFDVSTASYVDGFSVAAQQGYLEDLAFSPDGTKMYTCGRLPNAFHQYTLSTAWDISTASYASKSFSYASQQADGFGLAISADGSKIWVCGSVPKSVFEYDLGTAFDVSTSVYNSVTYDASTEAGSGSPFSIRFKTDGTVLYIAFSAKVGKKTRVVQYPISAWDISTVGEVSSEYEVEEADNIYGLAFSSDGAKMYVCDPNRDRVYEYFLAVAGSGSVTITASSIVGINDDTGFVSTDVGRLVAINQGGVLGVARITTVTSNLVVEVTVLSPFNDVTTSTVWQLGAWGETTGYPRAICLDNERMWHGGTANAPLDIFGSRLGVYLKHAVDDPLTDESGLNLTLTGKKASTILWLESGNKFACGTTNAEHWLSSASGSGAITPTSKKNNIGSSHGASSVKPIMIGNRIVYSQTHGKVIRELIYTFDGDNFGGQELQVLAEHLTRSTPITAMAYQRTPYKVIWMVRDDGKLLGLTYYPEQEVYGWHIHDIGGDGIVESITTIPGTNEDQLWMIVKRVINSATVRYIERLHDTFTGDDTTDAFYIDSGLTLDNRQDLDSLTYADPGVFNKVAHGYSDGDPITIRSTDQNIEGEEDLLSLNNERFAVYNKTADTFQAKDGDGNIISLLDYKQVVSATVALNVTSFTGLDHLEGETVQVLTDGYYQGDYVVSSGAITIDSEASVIHAGLKFISDLEPVPPLIEGLESGGIDIEKRITNINLELYKSLGFKYGPDAENLTPYQFSDRDDVHGVSSHLHDGYLPDGAVEVEGDYSLEPTV
ncbi:MAG: hypothetical protein KAV87_02370, partial [Desulfobacteraceae bacterium]|nr:hypothetical protein [Desulfobacteraceae bacterium]